MGSGCQVVPKGPGWHMQRIDLLRTWAVTVTEGLQSNLKEGQAAGKYRGKQRISETETKLKGL